MLFFTPALSAVLHSVSLMSTRARPVLGEMNRGPLDRLSNSSAKDLSRAELLIGSLIKSIYQQMIVGDVAICC